MKLTTEDLQRFVGGQLEVQNLNEDYLYRGEIASLEVTDGKPVEGVTRDNNGDLKIKLRWQAKMNDDREWEHSDRLDYSASLLIYSASDAGDGRLLLSGMYTGETVTLFPPDGSKLDPAEVKGLAVDA